MEKSLKKPVKDFMTKKVISVKENDNIKKLFKLMDKHAILGIPVVDEKNRVIGIVTESDLIQHFTTLKPPLSINILGSLLYLEDIGEFNENLKDHCAENVKDIMTKEVTTIKADASLLQAIELMTKKSINRLPIVDKNNKLIGIITRTDIVHQLAKIKQI